MRKVPARTPRQHRIKDEPGQQKFFEVDPEPGWNAQSPIDREMRFWQACDKEHIRLMAGRRQKFMKIPSRGETGRPVDMQATFRSPRFTWPLYGGLPPWLRTILFEFVILYLAQKRE